MSQLSSRPAHTLKTTIRSRAFSKKQSRSAFKDKKNLAAGSRNLTASLLNARLKNLLRTLAPSFLPLLFPLLLLNLFFLLSVRDLLVHTKKTDDAEPSAKDVPQPKMMQMKPTGSNLKFLFCYS